MTWVSKPTDARREIACRIEAAFIRDIVYDAHGDFDPSKIREAMKLVDFRRVQEILRPRREYETRPRTESEKLDGMPRRQTNDYLKDLIDRSLLPTCEYRRNAPEQMRAAQIATLYMENGATSEYERQAARARAKENNLTRVADAIVAYETKLLEAKAERGRSISLKRRATIEARTAAPA